MSDSKMSESILLTRRNALVVGSGGGGAGRLTEQKTGKWSDGVMCDEDRTGERDPVSGMITRSRVFPPVCVGKLTSCFRL